MVVRLVISILFISLTFKNIKIIKELIVPTKKGMTEIFLLGVSLGVFIYIASVYGTGWDSYLLCLIGITMFISMWVKEGITANGFISMYRYKDIILWNEIENIDLDKDGNKIKISLYGKFMAQNFYFKKEDYDKIMKILKMYL